MTEERYLYTPTTQEKCMEEIAALPQGLRKFLQQKLVISTIPARLDYPAYILRIGFGSEVADVAIDIQLLRMNYETDDGEHAIIKFILAEVAACLEGIIAHQMEELAA